MSTIRARTTVFGPGFAGRAALALAALASSVGILRADSLVLVDGKRIDGVDIVMGRWDTVQYKQGTKPAITLTGPQVREITRVSSILESARKQIEARDFTKALDTLKVAPPKEAWVLAEGMYLVAKARLDDGESKEAEAAFKAYLEKYKNEKDWFVPAATLGLGEALLASKQPGTAEVYFKELVQYGGQWEARAKIGQADALITSKGKAGALDARRLYDEVSRSREAPVELRQRALVGRGRVFLLQEQPQQVVKELGDAFFESPKPEELIYTAERAEASLLMGRAYMALGGKPNLEEAELWLLRVPAIYGKHQAAHAEACDLLVELYGKLDLKARAAEWQARKQSAAGGSGK